MSICKTCGKEVDFMESELCVKCNEIICEDCSLDNKFMCKDCNQPKEAYNPEFIRRSHIDDYIDCPFYFYLANIKKIPEIFSPQITTGIILHDLYEKWQIEKIKDMDELFHLSEKLIRDENFDDQFEEGFEERMVNRALDSTTKFITTIAELQSIEEAVAIEETIFFPISSDKTLPNVRITMDRIGRKDDGLHIHDWKTGATMTGKKLATNLQVPTYIMAVEHQYKEPVQSFELHYLGEGKTRKYVRIDDDTFRCTVRKRNYDVSLTEARKTIQTVFARIMKGSFGIPDRPSYIKCKLCSFRSQGHCQGSNNQSWIESQEKQETILNNWSDF